MLRSAPPLRRGALLIRGPWPQSESVGPGSAVPRRRGAAPRPGHVASIVESARAASPWCRCRCGFDRTGAPRSYASSRW